LRTGEKPEEHVAIWQRRGFKPLVVSVLIFIPLVIWITVRDPVDEDFLHKIRVRIESCTGETGGMWEEENETENKQEIYSGYTSWKDKKKSRRFGQKPHGPDSETEANLTPEETLSRLDRTTYFAESLISQIASPSIKPENNWYAPLVGEWDVAWIYGLKTANELTINGEWNFIWINNGEALQDILIIPYLWNTQNVTNPIRQTTIRAFNQSRGYWEGARLTNGRIMHFTSSRNTDGNIFESYMESQDVYVVWVFYNITSTSFQVTISQTVDGGKNYQQVGEIWAKKRAVLLE
jgi:hypothetical protein